MPQFYEVKIRYEKMQQDGSIRKVTEPYIADSVSCTGAEEMTIERLEPYLDGEYEVKSVKQTSIEEIISPVGEFYFLAKVGMITTDAKGVERTTPIQILIGAYSFDHAHSQLTDHFKDSMADYKILSLAETAIQDVFMYQAKG